MARGDRYRIAQFRRRYAIDANAEALARYAALCQEAGIVPIVEPEVLMDGAHTLERCEEVTNVVLDSVFEHLFAARVVLEGMVLKPNMVMPGKKSCAEGQPRAGRRSHGAHAEAPGALPRCPASHSCRAVRVRPRRRCI